MKYLLAVMLVVVGSVAGEETAPAGIDWKSWDKSVFEQAKREHKFVMLDLGTQWCHWCHVMDTTTYADAAVKKLLAEKYVIVRADADSRPDLASRYEDYGWPATIVFNVEGGEIVKRRGYITADEMVSMLKAIIADPTPGPSVQKAEQIHYGVEQALSDSARRELLKRFGETYDKEQGAWGHTQKFMDWDCEEWALRGARRGDAAMDHMARQTLEGQLNLLDPAWGGVYQYSTDDDWHHAHFEKIMQMQAENLRLYSLGYAQYHEAKYLHAAREIQRFLLTFLSAPDGGFYTSQDADLVDGVHSADYFALDDSQRRAKGVPRVDRHQFARENGWAITGLVALYEVSGDESALAQAMKAAEWVIGHRALEGGGFSHDERDASGPYLGDTLAMGRAFLELYIATADAKWLARAEGAADFVRGHFVPKGGPGVMTADIKNAGVFPPDRELDENVMVARWGNLLNRYSNRAADLELAKGAMKYLATPQIALSRRVGVGGILLANDELATAPLHVTVIGGRDDAQAAELYRAALGAATDYKWLQWMEPRDAGAVSFPKLGKAAAYVCTENSCSAPLLTVEAVTRRVK